MTYFQRFFLTLPLLFCLISNLYAQDNLAQGLDIHTERDRIKAERSQMEAEYSNTLRACYQKLNVNACKDDAYKTRLQKSNVLKAKNGFSTIKNASNAAPPHCKALKIKTAWKTKRNLLSAEQEVASSTSTS